MSFVPFQGMNIFDPYFFMLQQKQLKIDFKVVCIIQDDEISLI